MAQRVGPVSWVQSERFQRWLRAMNARKVQRLRQRQCDRRRAGALGTRDAIGAVRHVFLDADHDGRAVLSRVEARRDLPSPSYVLHSSPNHVHVFWRVTGFDIDVVERLQKQLARELQTDPAATPVTQNTRLPGFFNHKRAPATPRDGRVSERRHDLWPGALSAGRGGRRVVSIRSSARAFQPRCACHSTGETVSHVGAAGHCGPPRRCPDLPRLLPSRQRLRAGRRPGARRVVRVEPRCEPPWSPAELLDKLHRAARYGREPVGGLL